MCQARTGVCPTRAGVCWASADTCGAWGSSQSSHWRMGPPMEVILLWLARSGEQEPDGGVFSLIRCQEAKVCRLVVSDCARRHVD
jgi:hypothetical protein